MHVAAGEAEVIKVQPIKATLDASGTFLRDISKSLNEL